MDYAIKLRRCVRKGSRKQEGKVYIVNLVARLITTILTHKVDLGGSIGFY